MSATRLDWGALQRDRNDFTRPPAPLAFRQERVAQSYRDAVGDLGFFQAFLKSASKRKGVPRWALPVELW
eukprot:5893185-Pyramimonas_sp.AAC.1